MILLGLDIETGNPFSKPSGEDWPREESWLTEIGIVAYDTELGNTPVEVYSALINEGKGVDEDPAELTKITTEMIEKHGEDPRMVAEKCLEMLESSEYVFAHNARSADKPWLKAFLLRYIDKEKLKKSKFPTWVCSMEDIEYPSDCKKRSLGELSVYHQILNCFPHRAVTDVLTMMSIVLRYDLDRIIKLAESPEVIVKANFKEMDEFHYSDKKAYFQEGTDQFKALNLWKKKVKGKGFFWDADGSRTGTSKIWAKKVKEIQVKEGFLEELDFDYEVINVKLL
jgi:DNA polymerase-3 subunit epsilon